MTYNARKPLISNLTEIRVRAQDVDGIHFVQARSVLVDGHHRLRNVRGTTTRRFLRGQIIRLELNDRRWLARNHWPHSRRWRLDDAVRQRQASLQIRPALRHQEAVL